MPVPDQLITGELSSLVQLILEEALGLINLGCVGAIGLVINEVTNHVDALLDFILVAVHSVLDLIDDVHWASSLHVCAGSVPAHIYCDDSGPEFVTQLGEQFRRILSNFELRDPGWTMETMTNLPVLAINGATASGKTAVAVAVARQLGEWGLAAEIVNADSMLVYRGMDIGTAKPTEAERGGITHHLVDIAEVTETASVAEFQKLAREAIADCRSRGVLPILVGGSALYVHAIVDEFDFPATDGRVRARLESELAEVGVAALYQRLAEVDPAAAAAIQPGNARRIVRALEAIELTGSFTAELPEWRYALAPVIQVGLELPREELDERIDRRVTQMWDRGFVAEVEALIGRGLRDGLTASRAIGYRQVLAMLDGELSEAEARRQTAAGTRRLARKQLSWFRRDPRIHWFGSDSAAVEAICELVRGRVQAEQEVGSAQS